VDNPTWRVDVQQLLPVPDLRHCVGSGRVMRWEVGPIETEVMFVVVNEGIDGGPEAHPVAPPLEHPPGGPVVSCH